MSRHSVRTLLHVVPAPVAILGLLAFGTDTLQAQHSHAGHQHSQPSQSGSVQLRLPSKPAAEEQPAIVAKPPHGGKVTATKDRYFEVVRQSKELRVYLYDASQRPLSAEGVEGRIVIQLPGDQRLFPFPLAYVASEKDADQDYVAARVDMSRVKQPEVSLKVELTKLPDQSKAEFTQTLSLTKAASKVALVTLTEDDQAAIEKQRVCPVMGTRLGEMGTPVKVMVGDQARYLCCRGCLSKVQKTPQQYLDKVSGGEK